MDGRMTRLLLLLLPFLLAACSSEAPTGSLTAEEDRQLNEAAASLEANALGADDDTGDPE